MNIWNKVDEIKSDAILKSSGIKSDLVDRAENEKTYVTNKVRKSVIDPINNEADFIKNKVNASYDFSKFDARMFRIAYIPLMTILAFWVGISILKYDIAVVAAASLVYWIVRTVTWYVFNDMIRKVTEEGSKVPPRSLVSSIEYGLSMASIGICLLISLIVS